MRKGVMLAAALVMGASAQAQAQVVPPEVLGDTVQPEVISSAQTGGTDSSRGGADDPTSLTGRGGQAIRQKTFQETIGTSIGTAIGTSIGTRMGVPH